MTETVTTVSEEGYSSRNTIGDHELPIDATEEVGPNPTATLLSAYASCFVVGLRIAGRERGVSDLGEIAIEVTGYRDEDDELDSVEFDLEVEASLDREDRDEIVDRALQTCHVGAALRPALEATVTTEG